MLNNNTHKMSVCAKDMLSEALRKAARAMSRCGPDQYGFIDIDRFNNLTRGQHSDDEDTVALHIDVVALNQPYDDATSSLWASFSDKLPPPIEGNHTRGDFTSTGFRKYIGSIVDHLGEQNAWEVMLTSPENMLTRKMSRLLPRTAYSEKLLTRLPPAVVGEDGHTMPAERDTRLYHGPVDHFGCILVHDLRPISSEDQDSSLAPRLLWNELACALVLISRENTDNAMPKSLVLTTNWGSIRTVEATAMTTSTTENTSKTVTIRFEVSSWWTVPSSQTDYKAHKPAFDQDLRRLIETIQRAASKEAGSGTQDHPDSPIGSPAWANMQMAEKRVPSGESGSSEETAGRTSVFDSHGNDSDKESEAGLYVDPDVDVGQVAPAEDVKQGGFLQSCLSQRHRYGPGT